MKLTIFIIAFAGTIATAQTPQVASAPLAPLELKGISLGMPMDKIVLIFSKFDQTCSKTRDGKGTICMHLLPEAGAKSLSSFSLGNYFRYGELQTFAGAQIRYFAIMYDDLPQADKIDISMKNTKWESVIGALIAKFGKPQSEVKSAVQNRFGASFDQAKLTWTDGDGILEASKRTDDIDSMSVALRKKESPASRIESDKSNAKNL